LARALYTDADIYMFDEPLGAVDATVGNWIFQVNKINTNTQQAQQTQKLTN
jgi:ABC-type Mn2+/Zn2+ transport system ATPase subunit